MSPVWMFEGTGPPHSVSPGHVAERRFAALAAAVREHESRTRSQLPAMRPHDLALYRRLRQIVARHSQASSSVPRPEATGD